MGIAPRFLAIGTLVCAAACATATIFNFVSAVPGHFFTVSFWVSTFVSSLDILLLCALLALSALSKSERLYRLFGFLQYSAGSGLLVIFVGSRVLGAAGYLGIAVGALSMGFGAVCVTIHFAIERDGDAPRNEPLLEPAAP